MSVYHQRPLSSGAEDIVDAALLSDWTMNANKPPVQAGGTGIDPLLMKAFGGWLKVRKNS